MSNSSDLSKLPDWIVESIIGTRKQKPKTVKAPTKEKAKEYVEFELKSQTNEPSKVTSVKKA